MKKITLIQMLKGLKSLVAGVVAGTALGVFFAPEKGSKTRKNLKKELKGGGSGLESLKEAFSEMGADIKGAYIELSDELNKNEKFRMGMAKIKELAHKTKGAASEWIDENVPEEHQEQVMEMVETAKKNVKKTVKKAKTTAKKAQSKAKKAKTSAKKTSNKARKSVHKAAKKVAKKTAPKKKGKK